MFSQLLTGCDVTSAALRSWVRETAECDRMHRDNLVLLDALLGDHKASFLAH